MKSKNHVGGHNLEAVALVQRERVLPARFRDDSVDDDERIEILDEYSSVTACLLLRLVVWLH
jgi:hypothetical protein